MSAHASICSRYDTRVMPSQVLIPPLICCGCCVLAARRRVLGATGSGDDPGNDLNISPPLSRGLLVVALCLLWPCGASIPYAAITIVSVAA